MSVGIYKEEELYLSTFNITKFSFDKKVEKILYNLNRYSIIVIFCNLCLLRFFSSKNHKDSKNSICTTYLALMQNRKFGVFVNTVWSDCSTFSDFRSNTFK